MIALRFDEYFSGLYAEMIEAIDSTEIQELFENLGQQMEEAKTRLSNDANAMKYM
jgi:hypothetical protein